VNKYGTQSFTMLWDESFQSWQALGIASQPAAVLFSAEGAPIAKWSGAFPEDEVLSLAAESQAG